MSSRNRSYNEPFSVELTDAVPSLLLKHYIREIRANHKKVKLCGAQCRLIARRLGVIHDVLTRMPNGPKPSPGLLSAFQDACFIIAKMTVSEDEELSALLQGQANVDREREGLNDSASAFGAPAIRDDEREGENPPSAAMATATTAPTSSSVVGPSKPPPPPRWLFMLRQRFTCALIFNNFRQRLRHVWQLQPTDAWEAEDLKAQREDEETALRTLIEHAHVFDGTPMALPLVENANNKPSPNEINKATAGTAANGNASPSSNGSSGDFALREVDVEKLRISMRRAALSSSWKIDPEAVALPPNSYYSYEAEHAALKAREKGLLDRREEERRALKAKAATIKGGPLARQQLLQQQQQKALALGIAGIDALPTVMSPAHVKLKPPPTTTTTRTFENSSPSPHSPSPKAGVSDANASSPPTADVDASLFNYAECQQRFRTYLNGTFQGVPYIVLKELDPSLCPEGAVATAAAMQQSSGGGGGSFALSGGYSGEMSMLHPTTMENFIIDVTTRRGWCHPNLVDVIGGYAEILTETVDEATGLTELGAIPALGAVIEQLPTAVTVERRRQYYVQRREEAKEKLLALRHKRRVTLLGGGSIGSDNVRTAAANTVSASSSVSKLLTQSLDCYRHHNPNYLRGDTPSTSTTPNHHYPRQQLATLSTPVETEKNAREEGGAEGGGAAVAGRGLFSPIGSTNANNNNGGSLERPTTTNDSTAAFAAGDDKQGECTLADFYRAHDRQRGVFTTNSADDCLIKSFNSDASPLPTRVDVGCGGAGSFYRNHDVNAAPAGAAAASAAATHISIRREGSDDDDGDAALMAGRANATNSYASKCGGSAIAAAATCVNAEDMGEAQSALLALEEAEHAISSIPDRWQSSTRLYSTLHEMLFQHHTVFTMTEIIDIARQVADALQYISFDADNVTAGILRTWFSVTPSNIYLREISAEAKETKAREKIHHSKFEVRYLPRFHVADGPVNRWDPPFDAESPAAYAIAQLIIGMMTRQSPFRTAESQIQLLALLSGPAAVVAQQQQQTAALYERGQDQSVVPTASSFTTNNAATDAFYDNNGILTNSSEASFAATLSRQSTASMGGGFYNNNNQQQQQQHRGGGGAALTGASPSMSCFTMRPAASVGTASNASLIQGAVVGNVGVGGAVQRTASSTSSVRLGGLANVGNSLQQQPAAIAYALPKGMEVPVNTPPPLKDLLVRCLLRTSDIAAAGTVNSSATQRSGPRLGQNNNTATGKVSIAELREQLRDLFHSFESLCFTMAPSCKPLYRDALDAMSIVAGEEANGEEMLPQRRAANTMAGVASSSSSRTVADHMRESTKRFNGKHASLLEYGTEPQFYEAYCRQRQMLQLLQTEAVVGMASSGRGGGSSGVSRTPTPPANRTSRANSSGAAAAVGGGGNLYTDRSSPQQQQQVNDATAALAALCFASPDEHAA